MISHENKEGYGQHFKKNQHFSFRRNSLSYTFHKWRTVMIYKYTIESKIFKRVIQSSQTIFSVNKDCYSLWTCFFHQLNSYYFQIMAPFFWY